MPWKSGDWVRGYSAGIWQIVRPVPAHFQPRYSLEKSPELYAGPAFMLKRLVNDKWKPAFASEVCHGSLLRKLSKADQKKLDTLLAAEPVLATQLTAFTKPISLIWNLGFALPRKADFAKFQKHFQSQLRAIADMGLTDDRILTVIHDSPFAAGLNESPRSAGLQFACLDYEVRDKQLIYRSFEVLNF